MQPRSDGSNYAEEAVVDTSLCLSCGICVGACPTATPFRKASALSPGIDLPDYGAAMLRTRVEEACAGLAGDARVVVFVCQGSSPARIESGPDTAVVELRCMAHLPPSFCDYVLSRGLADGIFLAGCPEGDCNYRTGIEWTQLRLSRQRDPHLRKRVDGQRIVQGWDRFSTASTGLSRALTAFRRSISGSSASGGESGRPARPSHKWRRWPLQGMAYGLFAVAASVFAAWPAFDLIGPEQAVVSLSFSHAGQRLEACHRRTQEELEKLPPNMRKPTECPRERSPLEVVFMVDGGTLYQATLPPSGIWGDGESTVYARFPLAAGGHELFIGMNDSRREEGFDYLYESAIELAPGQHLVVGFDNERGFFLVH